MARSAPSTAAGQARRYGVTLLLVLLALLLTGWLLPFMERNIFLFSVAAVAVSAWYGGLGPGLLATVLSGFGTAYFFISPLFSLAVGAADLLRVGVFGLIAMLIASLSTARTRALAAAELQQANLAATLASIGDGVVVTDGDGGVTFLNGVAEVLTGWSLDAARGLAVTAIFDIVQADTRQQVENPVTRVLREGIVVGLANHTLLIARDGTARPIEDSGAPIRDSAGRMLGVVLVFRDATERMQAETERAALLEREQAARIVAEQAGQARDQFFSIAAHELKTPLTALFGNAQLLERRLGRETAISESNRRVVQAIAAQARRLNTLVAALLDMSRTQSGQLDIVRQPFDFSAMVARIVEEAQPALELHRIEYRALAAPLLINGDELRLEQVVQNLLQNAIKYSPDGGQIVVEVQQQGTDALLLVGDEGIGIPAEALPRLMDRFYRGVQANASNISGMGIGLYVVNEIVTLHGGRVEVESEEGKGSMFTVILPLQELPIG